MSCNNSEDEDFIGGNAGASHTYPLQCSALRKNGHVMMKTRPCKIVEMNMSKYGKHGHKKVHFIGLDLFTDRKYEDICRSTHNMEVPSLTRKDYQFLGVDREGFCSLFDETLGVQKQDLRLPDDVVGLEVRRKHGDGLFFYVTVLKFVEEERIVGTKIIND